jgi:N-formylmaleamate deformylase
MMDKVSPYDLSQTQEVVKSYCNIEALLPPHWSEDVVVANGIRLHYYRTGGNKPPLILLHGILDGALSWLRTAQALEQEYDVIMVDTRGHGLSERVGANFSQRLLVEDIVALIRTLRLDKPHLLGHSQGGTTGIFMAANYPELARSLIVEGWGDETAPANTDFAGSESYQAWFRRYLAWLEQLKTQSHTQQMLSGLSQLSPGAPLLPEEEYVPWVENCARLDLELVRYSINLWAEIAEVGREMVQALQRVTCPTLILKSAFFAQPGTAAYTQEEGSDQPNIKIIHFKNTGHLIHREQFELFIGVVKDFLKN